MIHLFLISALAVFIYMTAVFIIAQIKKNNSIVDIAWGPGFLVIALSLLFYTNNFSFNNLIITAMVFLWSARLSIHIFLRSHGKGEDFRYAEWRKGWGNKQAWNAFYRVFMLQAVIMIFVASPLIVIFTSEPSQLSIIHFAGIIIFLFGFLFESIADFQLYIFKQNPVNRGKIISSGLWSFTRHPNYFGEAVLWWGIGIYAAAFHSFYIALIGPFILNMLLLFVSGIPLLEKKYSGRPDWEEYKIKTPAFLPIFGKKG